MEYEKNYFDIFFLAGATAVTAAIFWHTRAIAPVDEIIFIITRPKIDKDSAGNVECVAWHWFRYRARFRLQTRRFGTRSYLSGVLDRKRKENRFGGRPNFLCPDWRLKGRILRMEFQLWNSMIRKYGGGSAGAATLWFQIEATEKPESAKSVFISETLFQP